MTGIDAEPVASGGRARRPRSTYLDALRAAALARVVVYHAIENELLTLVAAMPIMFFIAGSLYAGSLERRPGPTVVRDRYRRILVPYWVYLVPMVGLWAALGLLGELSALSWIGLVFPVLLSTGPGQGTLVELTWIALWYLQFHLILSLLGPWLRRAQLGRPTATWVVVSAVFVVAFAAGAGVVIPVFYLACWLLGYHQHDGALQRAAQRRWPLVCGLAGPTGLVLYLAFLPSSDWSGVSLRAAGAGAVLIGVFWLTLAMGLRPHLEPLLQGRWPRRVVHWFAQRSLSVYVWHMAVLYAVLALELPGSSWWPWRLWWVLVGTLAAVAVTGWSEDVAARRRVRFWPRLSPASC